MGKLEEPAVAPLSTAVLAVALLSLAPLPAAAQALPFHTPSAMTTGFNENAARHFVSVLGRGGLVRDGEDVADPMGRDISGVAVVNGAILGGFTPLWTVRVIVPWVRKTLDFTPPGGGRTRYETSGVGDALVASKWIFYRNDRTASVATVPTLLRRNQEAYRWAASWGSTGTGPGQFPGPIGIAVDSSGFVVTRSTLPARI